MLFVGCGVVWCGVVCRGVLFVGCGVVWCGVSWCVICRVWCGMLVCILVQFVVVWSVLVCCILWRP